MKLSDNDSEERCFTDDRNRLGRAKDAMVNTKQIET